MVNATLFELRVLKRPHTPFGAPSGQRVQDPRFFVEVLHGLHEGVHDALFVVLHGLVVAPDTPGLYYRDVNFLND